MKEGKHETRLFKISYHIIWFCSIIKLCAQTDNNQSVTVNGRIVNSATDGGESVQTISGKKVRS